MRLGAVSPEHVAFSTVYGTDPGAVVAQSLIPKGPSVDDPPRPSAALMEDTTVNIGQRKERRGFASMSPDKQREIARKGGRAAHEKGTAHEWNADEARSAGRKGGQVSRGGRGRLAVPPRAAGPAAPSVSERSL